MKVLLQEIKKVFDDLAQEKMPREAIAEWAKKRQEAEDDDQLEYDPPNEEDKIWDGIEYLMGVDLKDTDGSYLHTIESFVKYKNEKGL
ncbi:MAG: hypothetical protein K2X08_00075 [Chlamydiales bacterium]|nr:hypothetical protein [Chlamydiales bacterium]